MFGIITPEITRLDLNGCVGCARPGLGDARSDAVRTLLVMREKLDRMSQAAAASSQTGGTYLYIGAGPTVVNSVSNEERLAVNNALYLLGSPSSFATTSSYQGGTVVGNPTKILDLFIEINSALKNAGATASAAISSRPKWLIPVAVGAGVLVLGGILVAIARR